VCVYNRGLHCWWSSSVVALVSTIVLIGQYRKTKKEKESMKIESVRVIMAS